MGHIYTVLQNEIRYTLFIFFKKIKNKLNLITLVRKILKTFDMRDCLHTFIAPKCGRKKIVGNRGGARAPISHNWRRRRTELF